MRATPLMAWIWRESSADIADTCPAVGVPGPTALAIDPTNHASVWAGSEVDGIRHSVDGGRTWERAAPEIRNPDVHNILITSGPNKRTFVLVNNHVWISDNDGESWRAVGVREVFPWHYPRGIAARPDDPDVIFVSVGDSTPGRIGAVLRSRDAGATWETLQLPDRPNSVMWTIHISRTAPEIVLAASRYGYLYRSDDGGNHWARL
jgi:photosystem II stability/assembly factor-like uncharacterized protein